MYTSHFNYRIHLMGKDNERFSSTLALTEVYKCVDKHIVILFKAYFTVTKRAQCAAA